MMMTNEREDTDSLVLDEDAEIEADDDQHLADPAGNDGEAEFAIEIDGEEEEDETPLVRTLRQQTRGQARELAEYRKAQQPKIVVGEEPTLESCEYDEDKFKSEWRDWNKRSEQAANADADEQRQADIRNQEGQRRVQSYQQQMGALPLPQAEKDKAHDTVVSELPQILQAALLNYSKSPAKVVLALAKHPAKLAELANEADPIRFVQKVNEIERNLKVVNRKKPPTPEADTIQSGSASLSAGSDKVLEKLEKEAERTGDRSKLIAYKSQRKAA